MIVFFQEDVKQKAHTSKRGLEWISVLSDPCMKILILQKIQNVQSIWIYLEYCSGSSP